MKASASSWRGKWARATRHRCSMCWNWRKGERREAAAARIQTGLRMGGAPVLPALPDDGGAGLVTGGTHAAHRLHRARGRVRRADRTAVPMRLRAGSADEPAARRTALLACDAKRRRDGDAGSIGLAQKKTAAPTSGCATAASGGAGNRIRLHGDGGREGRRCVEAATPRQAEAGTCENRVSSVRRSGKNGRRARVARERRAHDPRSIAKWTSWHGDDTSERWIPSRVRPTIVPMTGTAEGCDAGGSAA